MRRATTTSSSISTASPITKIGFLRGKDLSPEPPVASKMGRVAYFHLHESEDLDHRFGDWLHQAAALPGVKM